MYFVLWYLWKFLFLFSTTIYELFCFFLSFFLLHSMMKRSFCECCFYWIINFWIANIYMVKCVFSFSKIINKCVYMCIYVRTKSTAESYYELLKHHACVLFIVNESILRWWNNKFVEDYFVYCYFDIEDGEPWNEMNK